MARVLQSPELIGIHAKWFTPGLSSRISKKTAAWILYRLRGKPGNYIPIEVFHAQIFHLLFIPELRYYQSNYE